MQMSKLIANDTTYVVCRLMKRYITLVSVHKNFLSLVSTIDVTG